VTQRALIAAALAPGRSTLRNPLLSDDPLHLIGGLNLVGLAAKVGGSANAAPFVTVEGRGGEIPARSGSIAVGNAGTAMRFLTALLALGRGDYILDGDARMRQRPIEDLLLALRALGGRAESVNGTGCPPVRVGGGLRGGSARLCGDKSSQYLSAILLAAPAAGGPVGVEIEGDLVSRPYVDLTIDVMRRFGAEVEASPPGPQARVFAVTPGRSYAPRDLTIEGDYSSASYFFAAAAVTGGRVRVDGLDPNSAQGDARFVEMLETIGCRVEKGGDSITVEGGGRLRSLDADCRAMPDIVPTLAVVACFAEGTTRITGVPHLRIKETDRIAALVAEITRLGGDAVAEPDGLTIRPRPLRGASIETHNDHRMAMAFAVAGLRVAGVVIRNPACVSKSFPQFWALLEGLVARPA
jgi:3-phosphoshikimate 1-carboxyvinyltransferase